MSIYPLRFPRWEAGGTSTYGKRYYFTDDGLFVITQKSGHWMLGLCGDNENDQVRDAFYRSGLRDERFPTRAAVIIVIEQFMETIA